MNRVSIVVLVAVVLLGAVGIVLSLSLFDARQPLAFNHRLHLEAGTECTDCHLYALNGVRATIPNIETCGACHEEAVTESPDEALLVEHVRTETPIPWQKVYWVPEDVYFSHRRHTALADIACEVCHGAVGERETPVVRPAVAITMDGCMECHQERGASNDCIICHR